LDCPNPFLGTEVKSQDDGGRSRGIAAQSWYEEQTRKVEGARQSGVRIREALQAGNLSQLID
jgi:hypothetical protein